MQHPIVGLFILLFLVAFPALSASAANEDGDGIIEAGEDETEELARAAQNPVASMISLPFQNNTNFNFGPREKTQNILNIQPVLPFDLTEDWNLITRTIVPVISQPPSRLLRIGKMVWVTQFSRHSYHQKTQANGYGVQVRRCCCRRRRMIDWVPASGAPARALSS